MYKSRSCGNGILEGARFCPYQEESLSLVRGGPTENLALSLAVLVLRPAKRARITQVLRALQDSKVEVLEVGDSVVGYAVVNCFVRWLDWRSDEAINPWRID
jgi:hypothetical protein